MGNYREEPLIDFGGRILGQQLGSRRSGIFRRRDREPGVIVQTLAGEKIERGRSISDSTLQTGPPSLHPQPAQPMRPLSFALVSLGLAANSLAQGIDDNGPGQGPSLFFLSSLN